MTIKELYEEALENGREDYNIRVQYQDGGGFYSDSNYATDVDYDDIEQEATIA